MNRSRMVRRVVATAATIDERQADMSVESAVASPERTPRRPRRDLRPAPVAFHYTQTDSFVALLQQLGASLLVSTYQANKLLVARAAGGGLSMLVRTFDRPMGLAVDARRLTIGTRNQIWFLRNAPDIAPRVEPAGQHDACFLPRSCHVTGDIGVHEMAWAGDELWVVNTRFSCLCTLDPDYSFVPRWRPPFITALAAEDRCHLNGLAIVDGRPKYVTALGETDTAGGWRANKPQGGCLLDVTSGEIDQPRPVDAALAALARRPALAAGIRHRAARARRSRHRPPADAWPSSPASPAAWRCAARTPSSAYPRSAQPPRWTACRWPSGENS